ncbi:siroheme synthase [Gloeophyllum trabeum ATCC 11539]|uniref:precorrin-2 dehydrogenase n=1 Tax=Gloeophyllum trabeum (strain ATCC 11539 / FP-39264 / Madison 617) TaxID=670483 RepID=S7RLP1_GLOTA|nr:siroheme synthase [Gloeophyllum trabeum ATCC 11539]EPQ55325.1 siroheme synthase [Gloeophyllum trabeum ATCC 11539]
MAPDPTTLHGGSLLIAWQLTNKRVLIVGGGDVASGRLESALVADANVTLVAPAPLHLLTQELVDLLPDRITWHDREFQDSDLLVDPAEQKYVSMVFTAIDSFPESQRIARLCNDLRIPVNAADIPALCDFYFGSQVRSGPLQVLVSTNGKSPKLANLIRKRIESVIPPETAEAIENVGKLRERIKERAPGVGGQVSKKRMRWMVDLCGKWSMEDLACLDDETMGALVDGGWEKGIVPAPTDVMGEKALQSNGHALNGSAKGEPERRHAGVTPVVAAFVAGALLSGLTVLSRLRR